MIPLEAAIPQVLRFSGCPGWPDTKEGQNELVETIARIAADSEHAQRIADAWLVASHWAPTPHNLAAIAQSTKTPTAERSGCVHCGETGWLAVPPREFRGRTYSSVKPCECRRTPTETEAPHDAIVTR